MAQITAAEQLNFWTKTLGLYWALLHGGAYGGFELETLKGLDLRKQLETAMPRLSGVFVSPDNAQAGSGQAVGTGRGSVFNWPDGDLTDSMPTEW